MINVAQIAYRAIGGSFCSKSEKMQKMATTTSTMVITNSAMGIEFFDLLIIASDKERSLCSYFILKRG